jgi:hypothetical protein
MPLSVGRAVLRLGTSTHAILQIARRRGRQPPTQSCRSSFDSQLCAAPGRGLAAHISAKTRGRCDVTQQGLACARVDVSKVDSAVPAAQNLKQGSHRSDWTTEFSSAVPLHVALVRQVQSSPGDILLRESAEKSGAVARTVRYWSADESTRCTQPGAHPARRNRQTTPPRPTLCAVRGADPLQLCLRASELA